MLIRPFFPIVVAALMGGGHEDSLSVREQENAFAKAVKSKDRLALSALMAGDFHVFLRCGSVEQSLSTDIPRQDWLNDLRNLATVSYKATVSKVRLLHTSTRSSDGAVHELPDSSMASATVDEFWTIRLPRGGQVERHFSTEDTWLKLQGTWKLAGRIVYLPHPCADDPYRASPH